LATDTRASILDSGRLTKALIAAESEVVIHLAAQPLVRESYSDPLGTFAVNAIGTANLLQAVRSAPTVKAVLVITTDKVYRNREWLHPYREPDQLGGSDPYSASKVCAELITDSFRQSFFSDPSKNLPIVMSARAGNVIGGGDWAVDRIVPDCLRAAYTSAPLQLRYPTATRPWQHVLDSLSGYLALLEVVLQGSQNELPHHWNFGPPAAQAVSVNTIVDWIEHDLGTSLNRVLSATADSSQHEAGKLALDSSQANELLQWQTTWSSREAVRRTVEWHLAWRSDADMLDFTVSQIREFMEESACPSL